MMADTVRLPLTEVRAGTSNVVQAAAPPSEVESVRPKCEFDFISR